MTALITGASSGLGAAYARHFAAHGKNLVLVARRKEALDGLADELRASHGIAVTTVQSDLSRADAGDKLVAEIERRDLVIDVLVNNAGFGLHGDVAGADVATQTNMVDLNCRTVVDLCTRFVPEMVSRGTGTIINIASTGAFQPLPHMAVYGATKAFVLSYTEALWAELREQGIRVIAVAPGATATEFFDHAGSAAQVGALRTPAQVIASTERGLRRGNPVVIDGLGSNVSAQLGSRLLPRRALLWVVSRLTRDR